MYTYIHTYIVCADIYTVCACSVLSVALYNVRVCEWLTHLSRYSSTGTRPDCLDRWLSITK